MDATVEKQTIYLFKNLYCLVIDLEHDNYLALRSGAWELNPLVRTLGNDPVKLFLFKGLIGLLVYLLVTDKNVLRYQKLVLLLIYTVIMVQAVITNIINTVI